VLVAPLLLLAALAPRPDAGEIAARSMPVASGEEDAGREDGGGALSARLVARLEPTEVTLGQPFALLVEVTRAPGERLEIELPGDTGQVELLAKPSRSLQHAGELIRETFRVPLAAFALRDVETPALRVISSAGEPLEVPPLPVSVRRSIEETGAEVGLAEAVGPVAVERFDQRPAALGVVALVFVGLWLLLWWLDRRRPPAPTPSARSVHAPPPHEVALERLRALERSSLVADGELEQFVDTAIAVLRWYLGERYLIDALDQTSQELHASLSQVLDARLDVAAVDAILSDADLVKFARAPTTTRACAQLLESIRALILATRPVKSRVAMEAA